MKEIILKIQCADNLLVESETKSVLPAALFFGKENLISTFHPSSSLQCSFSARDQSEWCSTKLNLPSDVKNDTLFNGICWDARSLRRKRCSTWWLIGFSKFHHESAFWCIHGATNGEWWFFMLESFVVKRYFMSMERALICGKSFELYLASTVGKWKVLRLKFFDCNYKDCSGNLIKFRILGTYIFRLEVYLHWRTETRRNFMTN